jgi:hypothetical protein
VVCVHTRLCVCVYNTHSFRLAIYCILAIHVYRSCDQLQFLLKNRVGFLKNPTVIQLYMFQKGFFFFKFWNDFYKISQFEPDRSKFND